MMPLKSLLPEAFAVAAVMLAAIGCGGQGVETVPTEMVEGVVTLDGQPVEGAILTFVPVKKGVGAAATGLSDAAGKYRLTAVEQGMVAQAGAGTLPGEYYVGVLKVLVPDPPAGNGLDGADQSADSFAEQAKDEPLTHLIPEKFNDPPTSGIKKTVKAGMNDIPIELTSK